MDSEINLTELITELIKIAKKNSLVILIIFIFSLGTGLLFNINNKKEYKSEAVIYWNSNFNSNASRIISRLNKVIELGTKDTLALKMNLVKKDIDELVSISLIPDYKNRCFYNISLSTYSKEIDLMKIEKGIKYYMKNVSFLKSLRESEINSYKNTLNYIEIEKPKLNALINENGNFELHNTLFYMQDKSAKYNYSLKKLDITFADSFSILKEKDLLKGYLLKSLFFGIILSLSFVFVMFIKQRK